MVKVVCQNCDARFEVEPSSGLELGPYRDGELDDPELDAAFDFDIAHAIGALDGGEGVSEIRLAPRTLAQAAGFHRALERPSVRVTSALVRGMGVVELDGERDPKKIARRLASAAEDSFCAVLDWFEIAHYPPRLDVPHDCPECGAKEFVPAPKLRELGPLLAGEGTRDSSFLTPAALEQVVREQADRIYEELGVRNVDLAVIEGPAETDDGGIPLLGCYSPADPDALIPRPPEIRIFHRTFENLYLDEGPYDVPAEVADTLRHELEHHLAFLAGDDPVDDEERAEIERDHRSRVGKHEVERRALRETSRGLTRFVRSTWPLWLVVVAATIATLLSQR